MSVAEQSQSFCIFFIMGLLIGFLFDIFRSFRKNLKFSDMIVYFQDIIFLFICGIFIFRGILVFNQGNIRFYIFIAIFLGILIYALTLSNTCSIILNVILKAIKKITKIIWRILVLPCYFLKKLFYRIKRR